ncbi:MULTISPECIES: aminodeoxychorismate/anthranilate synthase component II [Aerococcus]|uniref:Aminodeoxychorismate/anthranilate synthase component II n=2 Tax=Aerococcus TaxID=1375 RepID=A0A5N1GLC7_9LACT|nr:MULTISPECIES: aminodeoxychorismate/anthranilate synthase component II [Aerococcus]KAA9301785.1 aminodeoxychorismate/anthranilate synthase component II [Aerococcus sanguinicola]MDK6368797.1 aminodeoxychorismate/anthranilate synthase component II [Aerococcus sp. UMB9870]MDK6685761.1 aminodeoxychorismate/anthranilate synthase component II [Aerococcus sp. UMB8623]OFK19321.1 glutamine amidotransferase [Aerococcus sp. HMSC072A12]OFR32826.1 glutamine amidotransferase [Aerococcus sp. HMSC061A03]
MFLMIDNYDSFVYNLATYFKELGADLEIVSAGDLERDGLKLDLMAYEGLIISPGPKRPEDAVASVELFRRARGKLPVLGICLGHQVIAYASGAQVVRAPRPQHGKLHALKHEDRGLFEGLPQAFQVTRYHSLLVDPTTLPEDLTVEAWTSDGCLMALADANTCIYGVQFHPEAVLTEHGHDILARFIRIAREWRA